MKSLEEAEQAARNYGYRWLANPDPDLPYDALLICPRSTIAIRVKTVRNSPNEEDDFINDIFRKDLDGLRSLPFPPHVIREFWLRTQNVRGWRIFVVVEEGVGEIEFNATIGYYNPFYPHADHQVRPGRPRKGDTEAGQEPGGSVNGSTGLSGKKKKPGKPAGSGKA